MKNTAIFLILSSVTLGLSCNKNGNVDPEPNDSLCQWTFIDPILIGENLAQNLDVLFSDKNSLIRSYKDTTLFIINTVEELNEIYSDSLVPLVDMDTVTIVGVKILTSSISDSISSASLFKCDDKFKYEITINHCVDCWTALCYLYKWQVFKKLPERSGYSLILK
ncbi:MAG: hypothetical protein PHF38_00015 [Bacteroidales bacterium]|nr:hypothetical protein [Bacteroidales bacterium]